MKSRGPGNGTSFHCRRILHGPGPAAALGAVLSHSLFAWRPPVFPGHHCSGDRSAAWPGCLPTGTQVP